MVRVSSAVVSNEGPGCLGASVGVRLVGWGNETQTGRGKRTTEKDTVLTSAKWKHGLWLQV